MIRLPLGLVLTLVVLSHVVACKKDTEQATAVERSEQALAPADQTYVVRGQVKSLSLERKETVIQHEAIPQFVNAAGKRVGMAAMAMPFALGGSALSSDVGVGDKVEFTFEVRWKTEPTSLVSRISKLPADAGLEL